MDRLIAKLKRYSVSAKHSKAMSGTTATDVEPAPFMSESDLRPVQVKKHGLDSLPPEIRRHILSTLDVSQLKALVCAAANFHQQYIFDRKYLLCTCFERTLDSVTVDAYAVHLSMAQREDPKQDITDFLKTYEEDTSRRRLSLVDKLTQEEAISMTSFYFRYVEPLAETYTRWMLASLDEARETEDIPHSHQQIDTPTSTETMRVTRAIYRFQLLCNLAGPCENTLLSARDHLNDVVETLLDILEPWEVEELFSFYQFAEGVYDKIFKDIGWDLHPDNPKFNDQGRPPTPDGAFDLDGFSKSSITTTNISVSGSLYA